MSNQFRFRLIPLIAVAFFCLACDSGTDTKTNPDVPVASDSIAIVTPEPDTQRDELNAILKRVTMLDGITINGVSVGGMTVAEARDAVRATLNAQNAPLSVGVKLGDDVVQFSDKTIALTDDLDKALDEAFNLVREDNGYEAVMREVEAIKTSGREIPVGVRFDEAALKTAVDEYAAAHDVAATNASVAYNQEENKIAFTPEVNGVTVDRDALLTALLSAKNGETVEAIVTETPAEETLESIQSHFVLRGAQTTNYAYSGSSKNRRKNIEKGAGMLTGTILHPGEEFSMNDCLGVRNKAGGWYLAGAYQSGDTVQEYGGGVCQISTTLYNAALKADMKITDRRNHSMPVHYIAMGLDATINSVGNKIDFKFKNSSKADIIVIASADGKNLTVEIWGIPIVEDSDGKYDEIRIPDTKKTKTLKPNGEKEVVVDATKPAGYREESKKRREGSVWQSYIEYYKDGVLIEDGRKELATSTYKAFSGQIIVGPDPTAKPDDTPKPTSSVTPQPDPTQKPTNQPTEKPTEAPTEKPTEKPTEQPTEKPTDKPTDPPEPDPTDGEG